MKKLEELCSKNADLISKHNELAKKHMELARKHEDFHNELKRFAEDLPEPEPDEDDKEKEAEKEPKKESKKEENAAEVSKTEIPTEKLLWKWSDWMEKDAEGLMKLALNDDPHYIQLKNDVETDFRKVGTRGEEGFKEREKMDKNK